MTQKTEEKKKKKKKIIDNSIAKLVLEFNTG